MKTETLTYAGLKGMKKVHMTSSAAKGTAIIAISEMTVSQIAELVGYAKDVSQALKEETLRQQRIEHLYGKEV